MHDIHRWEWIDKTTWGDGPWQTEQCDKYQWIDEVTGLTCLAVRTELGHWCGYTGVAPGHPVYGLGYDDLSDGACIVVHGGLTFAGACDEGTPTHGICHVAAPGEHAALWWMGFDCAHWDDFSPMVAAQLRAVGILQGSGSGTYKPLAYVQAECRSLAQQLAVLTGGVSRGVR